MRLLSFRRLIAKTSPGTGATRPRHRTELQPVERIVYAIGDVHGCLSQLRTLEDAIQRDAAATSALPKTIVVLGDVVDRGPDSAAVIEHLMLPAPAGFSRLVLAGNHEADMLAAFSEPARALTWLHAGGIETLRSYGIDLSVLPRSRREARAVMLTAASVIPREHLEFLRQLPVAAVWREFAFVHAGCLPGIPIAEQDEAVLLTIREPFLSGWGKSDTVVVHGHTAAATPRIVGSRIQVDTACYATGCLSAARIGTDGVRFLSSAADR